MKRTFLIKVLSAVLCSCLLLTACSGAAQSSSSETSSESSSETSSESSSETSPETSSGTSSSATSETSSETSSESSSETSSTTSSDTSSEDSSASSSDTSGSHILVVYFSATGHTEAVATTIAQTLDADLFAITPVEPYTSDDLDWTNDSSRVCVEHEDSELQNQVELTTTEVEGWDNYDTVFFGYPIWWGNAAWPVNQFVMNNDFTGKTVIPFCTSSSSGIGQSGENLAQMAGTGDWQEGQRFPSSVSSDDVASWAQSVME